MKWYITDMMHTQQGNTMVPSSHKATRYKQESIGWPKIIGN